MPSLAEMLGYIVQPLGGPVIPILPKSPSNATGGSIPGVVPPKGPPLSSPAELMNALTAIGASQAEAKLKAAQVQELERQAELRKQLLGSFEGVLGAMGGGGGGSASPAVSSAVPAIFGSIGAPENVSSPNGGGIFATIRKYESGDDYNVGTGGTDLSKAPRDEYGFPIWEGKGNSHAAGAYQFQPGTWRQYAAPLGIKDFSKESQDAVARAAYLDQGVKPWAPYNPKLAAALARGEHLAAEGDAAPGQSAPSLPVPLAAALANVARPAAPSGIAPVGAPMSLAPVAPIIPQTQAPPGITPLQMAIAKLGMLGTLSKMGDVAGPLEKAFYNSPAFQGQVAGAKKGGEFPYDTAAAQFKADLDARNAAIAAEAARINADLLAGRTPGPGGSVTPRPGFAETEAALKGGVAGAETAARMPLEMARDRFKAQLDAIAAANRNIELSPNQRAFINPGRVPFPEVPGTSGRQASVASGTLAPGDAAPGAGMVLEGAPSAPIKFGEDLAAVVTKDFGERRTAALDAGKSLVSAQEARKLLDSGIVTGLGADFLLNFSRALSQAGLSDGETVANTQAFVASRAAEVGRIIKQFGAGTGLSDADREYATKASAGQIALDEKSIRRILDINERASRNVIKQFNDDASKVDPALSPFPLTVPVPTEPGRSGVTSGGVRWSRD